MKNLNGNYRLNFTAKTALGTLGTLVLIVS
jgi:hypothetical protein